MPLSEPVSRNHQHQRVVTCNGYRREDGLWDIEGHIIDTKSYSFMNSERGKISVGDAIHEMRIRLTMDLDFNIKNAEAITENSPRKKCGDVTHHFKKLIGLTIAPGWTKKTRSLLGGLQGCTHLVELLGPLATTAFQSMNDERMEKAKLRPSSERPRIIDTCHILAADGPEVKKRWPDFYTGKE